MASRPDLTGIRREGIGWRAYVSIQNRLHAKRFPLDTLPEVMQEWRAKQRTKAALRVVDANRVGKKPIGLQADVIAYLAIIKPRKMPTYATRKQHLEDWLAALGVSRDRSTITTAEIATQLARWQRYKQYSASTLNHRRHALAHLFRTLDPCEANPARGVGHFREPTPEPRGLAPKIVQAILDAMRPRDTDEAGSLPSRTAAQMRVLALTGLPPATIGRLTKAHLADIDHGSIIVPGRMKGRGTQTSTHRVTPEGAAALKHMAAIGAWGPIPSSTRLIVWRRAVARVRAEHPDWSIPGDARPYDLRHSFAELVYDATHDLSLTQGLLHHADARTTRRYAAGAIPRGEAAAAEKVSQAWREATTEPVPPPEPPPEPLPVVRPRGKGKASTRVFPGETGGLDTSPRRRRPTQKPA